MNRVVPIMPANFPVFWSMLLALVAAVLLWRTGLLGSNDRRKGDLWQTNLVAPCVWACMALMAIAATEIIVALVPSAMLPPWIAPVRYASAVATLCPAMAVLGAKRPQHRAWQFVVGTLWMILQIPSAQWLLFGNGPPLRVAAPWSWFLGLLILVGPTNYLATRFWPSALLLLASQLMLIGPFLPLEMLQNPILDPIVTDRRWAQGLLILSSLMVIVGVPRRLPSERPLDRIWLDYRDAFGALWGLRVIRRINDSAKRYNWSLRLHWNGFIATDDRDDSENSDVVLKSFRIIIQRFVSAEWVGKRLG